MWMLFFVCAVLGGSVFIIQFVMAIVGMGGDEFMDEVPGDIDMPGEVGDISGDMDVHGSTWLFGVISFRTVVAALTFFGLAGLGSLESELSIPVSLLIAICAGALAMYSVYYLMRMLYRLGHDATARIERTVGQRATVYIPIPANGAGLGKVQIRTQGRIMEYAAKTPGPEKLNTGTIVEVTCVMSPTTLEVEPVDENMPLESSDIDDE